MWIKVAVLWMFLGPISLLGQVKGWRSKTLANNHRCSILGAQVWIGSWILGRKRGGQFCSFGDDKRAGNRGETGDG